MQSETLRVYVLNAKFSALNFTSMKFVVAELSSQTLRGLRQVCEALNFNAKLHFYLVIHNVYGALKKSSSFRTLRKLHEL